MNNQILSKIIRNMEIRKTITPSQLQTKLWRNSQPWYKEEKKNECELYQRNLIELITQSKCNKTNLRINIELNDIINCTQPMTRYDAFDWTEDFDGEQIYYNNITLYYNLKMVIGDGGAQTRSLREVSHFIRAQLEYNIKHIDNPKYFVNILDGDTSYKLLDKFNYIINNDKYKYVKNFIYIGDMYNFMPWINQLNVL